MNDIRVKLKPDPISVKLRHDGLLRASTRHPWHCCFNFARLLLSSFTSPTLSLPPLATFLQNRRQTDLGSLSLRAYLRIAHEHKAEDKLLCIFCLSIVNRFFSCSLLVILSTSPARESFISHVRNDHCKLILLYPHDVCDNRDKKEIDYSYSNEPINSLERQVYNIIRI